MKGTTVRLHANYMDWTSASAMLEAIKKALLPYAIHIEVIEDEELEYDDERVYFTEERARDSRIDCHRAQGGALPIKKQPLRFSPPEGEMPQAEGANIRFHHENTINFIEGISNPTTPLPRIV